jgi:membrane fusion protein, copper/silver efflux system
MKIFTRKITIIIALLAVLFGAAACGKNGGGSKTANVDYYTCTMHPSVHSENPGKCPICSMDLVPVMKQTGETNVQSPSQPEPMKSGGEMQGMAGMQGRHAGHGAHAPQPKGGAQSNEFIVPVERQQQIGVTYAKVERQPLNHTIRSVGLIVPDKARNWQFVSRVDGYVQKLNVTAPGEIVEKDAPLLSIYSPDLLTTEREFVELLRMRDQAKNKDARETPGRLIDSAKQRLRLWNVTEEQITELERTKKPQENLTLLSPFRGIVQSVPTDQGKAVKVGDMLVEVADLNLVWVWAEFYENELPMLKAGQNIDITSNSYPGEKFQGTISVINPFLDPAKRTAKVRIDIPNPKFKLRPAMYVNAELAMQMGEGLTIPVSAVMPTGSRSVVFVDKGGGKLEPRVVQLGPKYGDSYEVQSGLQENERVIASANFLIDAESKVQGALKDFEEETAPTAGSPFAKQ